MDGFGGKPLPNLSFATFDLFAAFGAEVFCQFGERADHIRGVTEIVTSMFVNLRTRSYIQANVATKK